MHKEQPERWKHEHNYLPAGRCASDAGADAPDVAPLLNVPVERLSSQQHV